MPHIEDLRARLLAMASDLCQEQDKIARGEGNRALQLQLQLRFEKAMSDVGAEEIMKLLSR